MKSSVPLVRVPEKLALPLAAAIWLAYVKYAPNYLWRAFPRTWLAELTSPTYGMICQAVTLAAGLFTSRALLGRPLGALGITRPPGAGVLVALLAAPAVFVAASSLALTIAEPYLLRELATEGAGATQRNAGAFGQAVTRAPLFITLVWGTIFAAISEEFLFRGAIGRPSARSAFPSLHAPTHRPTTRRARSSPA